MAKGVFSSYQAVLLNIFSISATAVFWVPGEAVTFIKQDAWISIIPATIIITSLILYPLADLGMKYPGKTIVQYSENILGKFGGKLVGLLFVYMFFQIHCWQLRQLAEISVIFFPETPFLAFPIILSFVVAYCAYSGPEVLARCSEFVFPIGILILLATAMVSYSKIDFSCLLPIMESKMSTLLLATVSPVDWMAVGFVFGVLSAYIRQPANLKMVALLSGGISGILLIIFSILVISILTPSILSISNFAFFRLSQYVGIGGILENMEAFIIPIWFSWVFIKVSIFCYSVNLSLSQLCNFSDYRFLILPETFLAIAYSIYQYDNLMDLSYSFSVGHFYYLFFTLGLPFFLWIVSLLRSRLGQ